MTSSCWADLLIDHRRSDQRRSGGPGEEQEGGSFGLAIRPWRPRLRIKTANARLRTAETGSRTEFHSTALETSLMSDPVEADPGLVRSDWVTLDTETSLKLAHQICGEGDVAVGNLLDLKSLNDVVVLGRPSD